MNVPFLFLASLAYRSINLAVAPTLSGVATAYISALGSIVMVTGNYNEAGCVVNLATGGVYGTSGS